MRRLSVLAIIIAAVSVLIINCVMAGVTERVSISNSGDDANGGSSCPSVSADGRYVAFESYASNLVGGDTNGTCDVFVRDRVTGTTERVSVSSSGGQANSFCGHPSISADGRYVAFKSSASNLVDGDTNGYGDVFVRDRVAGATERISVSSSGGQANDGGCMPSISADGRYVAFRSVASNLVGGDTNGHDVFVRDRVAGTTERVSVSSSGEQANDDCFGYPSISADGRYVAFESYASNLVDGDTNNCNDVFVRDRVAGTTERVSVSNSGGQANNESLYPSISADGRYVAFRSGASNLVVTGNICGSEFFVRDRAVGTTECVSVSSEGEQAELLCDSGCIGADGRFIVFNSLAFSLDPHKSTSCLDVFIRDRFATGTPPPPGASPGYIPPAQATYSVGNPYSGYTAIKKLKGQLHSHYFQDAGAAFGWMPEGLQITAGLASVFPELLLAQYKALGFDFVCITEHNHCTTRPAFEPCRFIYQCEEAGNAPNHVLAIGTHTSVYEIAPQNKEWISYPWDNINNGFSEVLDTSDNYLRSIVSTIHSADYGNGVAILAHPNVSSYNTTVGNVTGGTPDSVPNAVSIYTAASFYDGEDFWDQVLSKNKLRDVDGKKCPIFGAVEDDYTPWYLHAQGRTWIAVDMDTTDDCSDNIVSAIRKGRYWMYRCPLIYRGKGPSMQLTVSNLPGKPLITATSDTVLSQIAFIGGKQDVGVTNVAAFTNTASAQFQCTGGESYVRVVGYQASTGMLIYSQPILILPSNGSDNGILTASVVLGTSPNHILADTAPSDIVYTYAQPTDLPVTPPPYGYIGHPFLVSTSSGVYPPDSTLSISYQGIDVSPYGTVNLAVYRWNSDLCSWQKLVSTVDIGGTLVTAPLTQAGLYAIGADIPLDSTAPIVTIHAPVNGATLSGNELIGVQAYDNTGIQSVSFFLDGISIGDDSFGPDGYTCQYDFSKKESGDYKLKAIARDLSGNTGEAEITVNVVSSDSAPTLTLDTPISGYTLQGVVPMSGTCADNSIVAGVFIAIDNIWMGEATIIGNSWSYDLDTSLAANGPHTISAIVMDDDQNVYEQSISVVIDGPTVTTLGDAKKLADGLQARISGRVVTLGDPGFEGAFYIEEQNRASGMRVFGSMIPAQGDLVTASGIMSTDGGERILTGANVLSLSSSNPLPPPIGFANILLGGGPFGLYSSGVTNGYGVQNLSLLVRIWGKVTQKGTDYLYINDGSNIKDGTTIDTEENVGVRVMCDPSEYQSGQFIIVTGISSCFETNIGTIARLILTRSSDDIQLMNAQ